MAAPRRRVVVTGMGCVTPLGCDLETTWSAALTVDDLAAGFQAGPDNPLEGLAGRAGLLNALGRALQADPAMRDAEGAARPGALFDILTRAHPRGVPAPAILEAVLKHLGPIWPSRLTLDGVSLGDCWRYRSPKPALLQASQARPRRRVPSAAIAGERIGSAQRSLDIVPAEPHLAAQCSRERAFRSRLIRDR